MAAKICKCIRFFNRRKNIKILKIYINTSTEFGCEVEVYNLRKKGSKRVNSLFTFQAKVILQMHWL